MYNTFLPMIERLRTGDHALTDANQHPPLLKTHHLLSAGAPISSQCLGTCELPPGHLLHEAVAFLDSEANNHHPTVVTANNVPVPHFNFPPAFISSNQASVGLTSSSSCQHLSVPSGIISTAVPAQVPPSVAIIGPSKKCISPHTAVQMYGHHLTTFEHHEIFSYPQIYYVSEYAKKIQGNHQLH